MNKQKTTGNIRTRCPLCMFDKPNNRHRIYTNVIQHIRKAHSLSNSEVRKLKESLK
jgi:hypothetical protein